VTGLPCSRKTEATSPPGDVTNPIGSRIPQRREAVARKLGVVLADSLDQAGPLVAEDLAPVLLALGTAEEGDSLFGEKQLKQNEPDTS